MDKQTEAPLVDANIGLGKIYGFWDETNHLAAWHTNRLVSTRSAVDGTFNIRPKKEWSVLIIPSDVFPGTYELVIQSTNHHPSIIRFGHSPLDNGRKSTENVGIIKLNGD